MGGLVFMGSIPYRIKKHYEFLGLEPTSNINDIRKVYRKMAKKYHPDTEEGDPELFIDKNRAYEEIITYLDSIPNEKEFEKLGLTKEASIEEIEKAYQKTIESINQQEDENKREELMKVTHSYQKILKYHLSITVMDKSDIENINVSGACLCPHSAGENRSLLKRGAC